MEKALERIQINQLDEISLQDLDVRCHVGIYPRERAEAQPIRVQLSLYMDTRRAAKSSKLEYSVDYASLADEIRLILQNARFKLIETAVEAIAHYVLSAAFIDKPLAPVEAVRVSIEKPKALAAATLPKITILRWKDELEHRKLQVEGVESFLVHSSVDGAILKTIIPPQAILKVSGSKESEITDICLGEGLLCDQQPVSHQKSQLRPFDGSLNYQNITGSQSLILLSIIRLNSNEASSTCQLNTGSLQLLRQESGAHVELSPSSNI